MNNSSDVNVFWEIIVNSFQRVSEGVLGFLPELIMAIIIVLIGWILGVGLLKLVAQIIRSLKIDRALASAGMDDLMKKSGFKLDSGRFLGELVKWFVIVIAIIAAFDVLGLQQVNVFLRGVVVDYIPQVIAAVLILLIAVLVAEALRKIVIASAKAADLSSANFLGSVTKWAIWIFAALAALFQLGIGAVFIQTLFTGVIVALALAFGLAFGIGGRDAAADFLDKMRDEIKD